MIFGIIILVLAAGIAFFHYVQGLFSAMISATLAILAALLAVSYHEQIAELLLGSSIPRFAHAVALVGLFGFGYLVLRLIVDRLVPGNVRFPVLVDKIGAGVFGLIAGIFSTGILAIAAQLLPMGPSIAGYSRFELDEREVTGVRIPGRSQLQDLVIENELKSSTLSPSEASSMGPLPVDSMVLGLVSHVSDGGSLAGDRPLSAVHPSYLDELFAHRLGPALGGDVLVTNSSGNPLQVSAVFSTESVLSRMADFELPVVRAGQVPEPPVGAVPVVVRTSMSPPQGVNVNAFNMGSIRLVVEGNNYYPVGSLQKGQTLLLTKPDDYLFVDGSNPIDLVFMVEAELLPLKEGGNQRMLPQGSFIQARRAARVDLSGKEILNYIPSADNVGIVEKDPRTQR